MFRDDLSIAIQYNHWKWIRQANHGQLLYHQARDEECNNLQHTKYPFKSSILAIFLAYLMPRLNTGIQKWHNFSF